MDLKVASPALICETILSSAGLVATGAGRLRDVVDQEIAFVLVHIQALGGEAGEAGVSRLVAAGDFEPHLAGGGGEDEFLERCRLCLPSEAADASILEAADSSLDLRRAGRPPLRGCLDRLVGYGVDPARSEQRRWVPLASSGPGSARAGRARTRARRCMWDRCRSGATPRCATAGSLHGSRPASLGSACGSRRDEAWGSSPMRYSNRPAPKSMLNE